MHAGSIIGFTNLGDVNTHLEAFEKSLEEETDEVSVCGGTLADSMLVFMVRGEFRKKVGCNFGVTKTCPRALFRSEVSLCPISNVIY